MTLARGIALAIATIVIYPIALRLASDLVVDWAWLSSVGFFGVFWTIGSAKSTLFSAAFVATAAVVWVNVSGEGQYLRHW